jgi:predicted DNA-binding transcriptional regulator AlpA
VPNRQGIEASEELVPLAYVTQRLAISRASVYRLESEGVLHPVRFTPASHRRFKRAEVDALATAD